MAKKFKFGLESVLKLRAGKVDEAKASLGKVISLKNKRLSDVQLIEKAKEELMNEWAVGGKALFAQAYIYNREHLEKEAKKIYQEIEKIKQVENVRRKTLNLAMQEEKVMEKLKEKKFEDYKKIVAKEEDEFLDEVGKNIFLR